MTPVPEYLVIAAHRTGDESADFTTSVRCYNEVIADKVRHFLECHLTVETAVFHDPPPNGATE